MSPPLLRPHQRAPASEAFLADLKIPTTAHAPLPYIMGYDLYPMDALAFKRGFLVEAVERDYLILFEHDPDIVAGRLGREGKGFGLVEPHRRG
jgi:hypothetical protein